MTTPNDRFNELMSAIREPGEEGVNPSIYDDLTAVFTGTFENYTESVRTRDEKIAELEGKVGTLKSQNFDLLMKVGTGDNTPEDESKEVVSEPTIDTLFVKRK